METSSRLLSEWLWNEPALCELERKAVAAVLCRRLSSSSVSDAVESGSSSHGGHQVFTPPSLSSCQTNLFSAAFLPSLKDSNSFSISQISSTTSGEPRRQLVPRCSSSRRLS
ncbi:unnamed protein product [Brassica oleracea]